MNSLEYGWKLYSSGHFELAEQIFKNIIETDDDSRAYDGLGVTLVEQKKCKEALAYFNKAGEILRNEITNVSCNRARCLADMGMAKESLVMLDSLIKAYPGHTVARYNRGLVYLQMCRYSEAIEEMNFVLAAEPNNDKAKFGRGFANLVLGRYEPGFRDYEFRHKGDVVTPEAPEWTGDEDIKGRTILVVCDMGYGDNIMFGRYLPLLVERGADVLVYAPPSLEPLYSQIEGVRVVFTHEVRVDYFIRCMSLAAAFKTTINTVPKPMPIWPESQKWEKRFKDDGKLRVGLCWTGSTKSFYDEHRSIPLEMLRPLFMDGITFYSLQKEVRDSDREAFNSLPLVDLASEFDTFADTAGAMVHLDRIVTVDTSVAHLAGTLGVPTTVLLTAYRTYWLWISGINTTPWYPSINVIKQDVDGNWSDVVEQVRQQLASE